MQFNILTNKIKFSPKNIWKKSSLWECHTWSRKAKLVRTAKLVLKGQTKWQGDNLLGIKDLIRFWQAFLMTCTVPCWNRSYPVLKIKSPENCTVIEKFPIAIHFLGTYVIAMGVSNHSGGIKMEKSEGSWMAELFSQGAKYRGSRIVHSEHEVHAASQKSSFGLTTCFSLMESFCPLLWGHLILVRSAFTSCTNTDYM